MAIEVDCKPNEITLTHDEIPILTLTLSINDIQNWKESQHELVEPVRPDVSVCADDPDVGEALALLAQLGHAGDVRVVPRQQLHPGGRGRSVNRRDLDLGRVPLDVDHHGGHGLGTGDV